jgi:hypothetical protein
MIARRRWLILPALLFAFACSDDLGLGGENSGGDFNISVGSGTTPEYSWSGLAATSVAVYRTSNTLVPVWHVSDPSSPNMSPPVRHGTVPSGAVLQSNTEPALTVGIDYRVEIRLSNNSTAFRVFRP